MKLDKNVVGVVLIISGLGCGPLDEDAERTPEARSGQLIDWDGLGQREDISFFSPEWPNTAWQSEVAAVALNNVIGGAFNAEDTNTAHVTYPVRTERDALNRPYVDRIVCPGTSQVGRFRYDDTFSQWVTNRLSVPSGWAFVWGDPAAAVFEGNLWISSLASPTDYFTAKANTTVNGQRCYRTSDYPGSRFPRGFDQSSTPLGGAVAQGMTWGTSNPPNSVGSFRRSNGVDSPTGTDFLDGGSMVACFNALYAVYRDSATSTVAMYRKPAGGGAWAPVAGDNAIMADDHPLVFGTTAYTGVWLLTVTNSNLTLRTHNANGFSAPRAVGSGYDRSDLVLKGGVTVERGRAYAAVVAPNPNDLSPAIWIAYEALSVDRITRRQIILEQCTATACQVKATFGGVNPLTHRGDNAFMPAMALAYHLVNGTPKAVLGVTYLTDSGLSGNQVFVAHYDLAIPSNAFLSSGPLTKAQTVCPGQVSRIGEYDAMVVWANATATPQFNRFITDFTDTTCDTTSRANLDYRAQDQHITDVSYNIP